MKMKHRLQQDHEDEIETFTAAGPRGRNLIIVCRRTVRMKFKHRLLQDCEDDIETSTAAGP